MPRMGWVQWGFQVVKQRAIRLHVKLRLADLQPDQTELAEARICERAAMRRMIKAGEFYLGDRNYGTNFAWFDELDAAGCGCVLRLLDTIHFEVVEALDEVTGLYRRRWEVEMFFRWLKSLAPCRHWFAESREGVRILIYPVLFQALMLADLTGNKPNKRMMELLHWHQLGWADDGDLAKLLGEEETARRRRAGLCRKSDSSCDYSQNTTDKMSPPLIGASSWGRSEISVRSICLD